MPPQTFFSGRLCPLPWIVTFLLAAPLVFAADNPPSGAMPDLSKTAVLAQADGAGAVGNPEKDGAEITIMQALERPIDLEVNEMPIREVIRKLSESTGLPMKVEERALGALPYGYRTTLTAAIKAQPLKEILTALLRPIGLTFEVQKKQLMIVPTKHLLRIVRRATWQELEMLEMLYSRPWSEELFNSLRFQFQDAPAADVETNRETLRRLANAVGEGTAAEVLEMACDQYGWAWFPWDEYISIVTKKRMVERQLEKRISFNYQNITLNDALLDMVQYAGVLLRMDPGVMASLPRQTTERFSMFIENASIRQALEIISGQTGLGYYIEPDGVRMTASNISPPSASDSTGTEANATARATVAALRSNSIVGQITIPNEDGSSFSFFIRENDIPAEVNEMRKAKIRKAINDIRKSLQANQEQD